MFKTNVSQGGVISSICRTDFGFRFQVPVTINNFMTHFIGGDFRKSTSDIQHALSRTSSFHVTE